jgi:alpha-glucosidase
MKPEHAMPLENTPEAYKWWQTGVIYQIYPRSYQDTNEDGVGDLPGILQRLPYLRWLGVDAIWISPIYPSPMADFGYDVSDYEDIHPLFGTLEDFDRLLAGAHEQGLKVILDFVPNHTSDQHPWFLASRSSRDDPKRDWYIWADASPGGGPPNNWLSVFGGPAWTLDEGTGQYYLHSFLKEQPDLNWRNTQVREAMLEAMRFWLDRGVDGFRVDVIDRLIKDEMLRDDPPNAEWRPGMDPYKSLTHTHSMNRPEVHDILRSMRSVLDSYPDRMMVGESYLPLLELVKYYGKHGDEAHLSFNFELIRAPWDPDYIRKFTENYERALPHAAWPNWVLGNHDRHRVATRLGHAQARVACMLLLTLRGTPTLYYGDELGMTDGEIPPDKVQDPWEKNVPGMGLGRDPERTPMQWDSGHNAGFSTAEPWLPVSAGYRHVNVETERDDPDSMLHFVRALLSLRRHMPALTIGGWRAVHPEPKGALAYVREHDHEQVLIALNFTEDDLTLDLTSLGAKGRILISTHPDRRGEEDLMSFQLRGNEGIVARL